MDLSEKYHELISLLSQFLIGDIPADTLQAFVWEAIDYFSSADKRDLPPKEDFEKVFWYVVWEVQHLLSEDHLEDGSAQRELEEALEYLKGEQSLPEEFIGRRP